MKILMVNSLTYFMAVGGAEKVVHSLCAGLADQGHEVTLIALSDKHSSVKSGMVENYNIIYLPIRNIYWPFDDRIVANKIRKTVWHMIDSVNTFYVKEYLKIIMDLKPEILHTHNLSGLSWLIWLLAKIKGIKIVHTSHDYYLECIKTTKYRNGSICNGRCAECVVLSYPRRVGSQLVNSHINISEYVYVNNNIAGIFRNARNTIIRSFVAKNYMAYREDGGYEDLKKIRLGFVGRIEDEKGIIDFLRILIKSGYGQRFSMTLAGRGKTIDMGEILLMNNRIEIELLGYVDPIKTIYPYIDYLIVPSKLAETFGLVVIEALQNGITPVVSNLGALSETMKFYGSGYVFDIYEPESVTKILSEILMIEVTRPVMKKDNLYSSHSEWINKHVDLYKELIA